MLSVSCSNGHSSGNGVMHRGRATVTEGQQSPLLLVELSKAGTELYTAGVHNNEQRRAQVLVKTVFW